jgi:hypothetical protein
MKNPIKATVGFGEDVGIGVGLGLGKIGATVRFSRVKIHEELKCQLLTCKNSVIDPAFCQLLVLRLRNHVEVCCQDLVERVTYHVLARCH